MIAFPSATKKGRSKIVTTLSPGAGVVSSRAHVRFVVTEWGIADLQGKTIAERAKLMIGIAHPDQRDFLHQEARKLNII
jgi:acyl-CoA hydrolase